MTSTFTRSLCTFVSFFSQFAKGYWVFSIVLEIQYPSEIVERRQSPSDKVMCWTLFMEDNLGLGWLGSWVVMFFFTQMML